MLGAAFGQWVRCPAPCDDAPARQRHTGRCVDAEESREDAADLLLRTIRSSIEMLRHIATATIVMLIAGIGSTACTRGDTAKGGATPTTDPVGTLAYVESSNGAQSGALFLRELPQGSPRTVGPPVVVDSWPQSPVAQTSLVVQSGAAGGSDSNMT